MTPRRRSIPRAAGVLGGVVYLLVGWTGLLVPSLVRSVELVHQQNDDGIGVYYLIAALAYAAGSFFGGLLTERIGRRRVLTLGATTLAVGLIGLGITGSWTVFLAAGVPLGLGVGALDGGANSLFLDLYVTNRGQALNLLHLCFSIGAFLAPLVIGPAVDGGLPWQTVLIATGAAVLVVGGLLVVVAMPEGRRSQAEPDRAHVQLDRGGGRRIGRLPGPLLLLCFAIGCYIASEVGVTDWLIRFLAAAPLTMATGALALYWAGLAIGRLVSARVADRFDHLRYVAIAASLMSIALLAAVIVPSIPLSIAFFALAGLAAGPVAPLIVAVGGDLYPDRSAVVGGYLTTAAIVGSIGLPTVMGYASVSVGLTLAMLATVGFGVACAGALWIAGRRRGPTEKGRILS